MGPFTELCQAEDIMWECAFYVFDTTFKSIIYVEDTTSTNGSFLFFWIMHFALWLFKLVCWDRYQGEKTNTIMLFKLCYTAHCHNIFFLKSLIYYMSKMGSIYLTKTVIVLVYSKRGLLGRKINWISLRNDTLGECLSVVSLYCWSCMRLFETFGWM